MDPGGGGGGGFGVDEAGGAFNRKSRAWRTSLRGNDGGSARTGLTKTTTRRTTNTTYGKQQQPETTLADFDDGFIDRFDERLIHFKDSSIDERSQTFDIQNRGNTFWDSPIARA